MCLGEETILLIGFTGDLCSLIDNKYACVEKGKNVFVFSYGRLIFR